MATSTIKLRGDTTANWVSSNPVLAYREAGVEFLITGAIKLKVGDGTKTRSQLPYTNKEDLSVFIQTSEKGANGGVATLGSDGKVPTSQLPSLQNITISSTDKVLTLNANQLLATIGMSYVGSTGLLTLTGKDNSGSPFTLASVNLPLDKFLESASIVTNPSGQPAGTYLALVFNTDSGDDTIYVNVEGLIEVYTAGNGLELMNGVFKAVAKAGSKITVDSTGIGVDLSSYYTKTEVDNLLKTIDGGSA